MRLSPRLFFHLTETGIIFAVPAGIVADKSAAGGLYGLMANVNNYSEAITNVVSAVPTNLSAAQLQSGIVRLTAGAGGGFLINLPATSAILGAMGPTIAFDGSYAEPISIQNDAVGQTGTVTAGDASTTLVGTMTIATNTRRLFLLTVTSTTTLTINNIGSMAL